MAPQYATINFQNSEKVTHFLRGDLMKPARERRCVGRLSIAGAIGDQKSILGVEHLNLRIEPIHSITPTALQKEQRNSLGVFAIKQFHCFKSAKDPSTSGFKRGSTTPNTRQNTH